MKVHTAVVEGVQSLKAQLQARQSEEPAIALRDKAQLVVQVQERVRVEELAELPYVLPRHAPGGMSVAQWAEGLEGSQAASFRIGWLAVRSQPRDPQPERSPTWKTTSCGDA